MTTIYFAGSEDIDFTAIGTLQTPSSSGYHRSAWVRTGVAVANTGAVDPPANRIQLPAITPVSTLWLHAWVAEQNPSPTNNAQIVRWLDSAGTCRLAIRSTATLGTWGFWTRNAAGTFTQLGSNFSGAPYVGTPQQIDVAVNYSTTGSVTVYINAVQAFTYSGNITTDSATALAQAELADAGQGSYSTTWSEVTLSDTDSRAFNVWLMNSSTSGTDTQWTGTASNVNQQTINDANYVASATAGQINDYKTGGIALPTGIFTVAAVIQAVRASVGTTGPQHVQSGFNFNGSRYWGSSIAPAATFTNYPNQIWLTNPNTGVAWLTTDLTAATFNYSIMSAT